jgi:perosamine synthetase
VFEPVAALGALESVVAPWRARKPGQPVSLHEPIFEGKEREYVNDAIGSTFVSSVGEYVNRFERDLAKVCGVNHAVAAMNGTAALHICLLLCGVERDDEVLAPALTFVATANAIAYCGAIPHFCDASETTLGLDPAKLDRHLNAIAEMSGKFCRNRETGRRIRAVMPMHTFGHPVELDELSEVCGRWNLALIEDNAEGLGSLYKGKPLGSFGRVSGLSFNGNKIVTTGGGGAILTDDPVLAKKAKHLTTTAKLPHRWRFDHDELGYNYRMPNLNAALGCAQLEMLPEFLAAKRALAARYQKAFAGVPGARVFTDAPFAQSNYWLVAMILNEPDMIARDDFLSRCHDDKLLTRPIWGAMHRQGAYLNCPRMDLSMTDSLEGRIINLPSSPFIETAFGAGHAA